ncbi:AIF_collapsed_G0031510.mRNA.1.CDS.1 [Saccharomyces cerevisiae]|nr:AIF_collapsed_G0031510.mRNA.1.CDS.1 [Saccharomyces cerevisiae]
MKGFAEDGDEDDVLEYIGSETEHTKVRLRGTKDSSIDDIDELIQDMEIKEEDENDIEEFNAKVA